MRVNDCFHWDDRNGVSVSMIDVTVANITADTYINKASKKRGSIAALKEIHKHKKYQNKLNIKGIGLKVFGAISNNGKEITHYLANRISLLKINLNQYGLIKLGAIYLRY